MEKDEFEGFFANSAFRSGYFVVASVACISAMVYDLVILMRHWHVLPTGGAPLLLITAGTLISFLWMALAQHAKVRQFLGGREPSDIEKEASLHAILLIAARTTLNLLFFGSLAIAALLIVVDQMLSRT